MYFTSLTIKADARLVCYNDIIIPTRYTAMISIEARSDYIYFIFPDLPKTLTHEFQNLKLEVF